MREGKAEARQSRTGTTSMVFVFTTVLLFTSMDRSLNLFDEGLVLTNAMRAMSGEVVHRDYYSPYGPASYYIIGLLIRSFANSFIAARIFGILIMAAIVAVTFSILRSIARLATTIVFTTVVTFWMMATPFYLYPEFPCLLLALIGSALLQRSLVENSISPVFLSGCCTGAAALFRYDGGFLLAVAHLASLTTITVNGSPRVSRGQHVVRVASVYGGGLALLLLPLAAAYFATGSVAGFLADIVDYPLHYYGPMRGLPFPGPITIAQHPPRVGVYVPVIATMLALLRLIRLGRAVRKKGTNSEFIFLTVFTLMTATFYLKGVVRVSILHMMISIVPANLVLAVLVDRWWTSGVARIGATIVAGGATFPAIVAAAGFVLTRPGSVESVILTSGCPNWNATRYARILPDYIKVSNYILREVPSGERIFVGLDRHDTTWGNPVGLYFITGRLPGTHWQQFDPGLQTRSDIQQQIITDLSQNGVRWLIRDAGFASHIEPNGSRQSSGVHLLDQYLSSHYRPIARAGEIWIWLSNRSHAPQINASTPCMPPLLTH